MRLRHAADVSFRQTNTFRFSTLKPIRHLLRNVSVAWFEQPNEVKRGSGVLYKMALDTWRCTVVVPYLANPHCDTGGPLAPDRISAHSVFFQGSWAAASGIRGLFSELQALPRAHVRRHGLA